MARRAFLVSGVLYAALLVLAWFVLPERVPMHFGGDGAVDRWAGRTEAVLTLAAIGLGLGVLMGGLAVWMPRMPAALINMPGRDKDWWLAEPDREQRLRGMLAADLWWFATATLVLLGGIVLVTIGVADEPDPRLGPAAWLLLGGWLVVVLGYSAWLVAVRYRAPRGEDPTGGQADD